MNKFAKRISTLSDFDFRFRRYARLIAFFFAALFIAVSTKPLAAGVSGENVVVVVNGDSADSRTLANHYVLLRKIPSNNVIVLNDVPTATNCSLADFQAKILTPVLEQIDARKLAAQTKVVAYSLGFPLSVDVRSHHKRLKDPGMRKVQRGTASITGLTYFYNFLQADSEGYLGLDANFYVRGSFSRHFINPFGKAEQREIFEQANDDRAAGKFAEAAAKFESLYAKSPLQAPLAILAAECHAENADNKASARMIRTAIAAGWTSGKYFDETSLFKPVVSQPEIKPLIEALERFPTVSQAPVEFSSTVYWSRNGWPSLNPADGVRHLTSCVLGIVNERGSTMDLAISTLRRAASSDQTFPKGEFWFTKSGDVRTKTRFTGIPNALLWLGHLGKQGRITRGALPTREGDCVGLMLGTPNMKLAGRRFNLVPGSIADNLTSHGGNYRTDSQTKMTELLHCGAAMTSGSVAEPFALQQKFPLPVMYGFYAGGSSAIESFYLSIASPYQTLIVGDPMTAPFASIPSDRAGFRRRPSGDQFLVGWKPQAMSDPKSRAVALELYVNGKLLRRSKPERTKTINVKGIPDGKWPLRLTLISGDSLRSRAVHTDWIEFGNSPSIPFAIPDENNVRVSSAESSSIKLMHHSETVGEIEGNDGTISIDAKKWGRGPLRVRPVAIVDGKQVFGKDVVVNVP
ncbi:hypothetical protein LF1_03070 [Rubripirellula obstinata]|uniref:TIGR03790 family protein n=1 Tax=Rubripirellula obstinata TaxID=406547 RepID=A0A5B1C9J9_9BACT|nr:hypothetical protein [Rubripirellula obstinata]KAA1257817.1 hypothetical protein LF1_03070 [Rubripirellula obstinata]